MKNSTIISPQEEAITFLSEALSRLTSSDKDLKSILRKCQHACELLGWEQQKKWIHQELNGYYQDSSIPSYRKISGKRMWDIDGSRYDKIEWLSELAVQSVDPATYEEEDDILVVWSGIDWIISASKTGYREELSETKQALSPFKQHRVTLRRVRSFSPTAISAIILEIEKNLYDFISSAYVQLKYSNATKKIWDTYQVQVDKALFQLGFTQHLSAIESNLLSNNPEAWRVTAYECRNLLNDLANHLWRDTRSRYEYLPGKTDNGKLDVSQGKFGNRLSAYLHQKSIVGTYGKYLRDEAERLSLSIQSLISLQSEAHEPLTFQIARSVTIATYILIGEIIIRTDLVPIERYKEIGGNE